MCVVLPGGVRVIRRIAYVAHPGGNGCEKATSSTLRTLRMMRRKITWWSYPRPYCSSEYYA